MLSPPVIIAILFAISSILFLSSGIVALRKKRLLGMAVNLTLAMLLFSLAGLFCTIAIATQGYRTLTHEELAAIVKIQPTGPKSFNARFLFPDGREATFDLAGDELYVDAQILKWKPIANLLGLHTVYELDRVAGRYSKLQDEKVNVRTVVTIAQDKPVDMFKLRQRYSLFKLLVDAEYGSATFIVAEKASEFELRISTTGLLLRSTAR